MVKDVQAKVGLASEADDATVTRNALFASMGDADSEVDGADGAAAAANGKASKPKKDRSAGRSAASFEEAKPRVPMMSYKEDPPRRFWDLFILALLIYVGITVPYFIGFDVVPVFPEVSFFLNLLVDVSFLVDVVLNFRTPVHVGETDERGEYTIDTAGGIAKSYLTGWFWIDFPTCIPFDKIIEWWTACESNHVVGSGSYIACMQTSNDAQGAKLLRMLRIVRLARGLRFLKMMKMDIFKIITETLGIGASFKYYGIAVVKLFLTLLIFAHLNACGWYFIANKDYTCPSCEFPNKVWVDPYNVTRTKSNGSDYDKYIAALYWAVQTMTTVGYGDMTPDETAGRTLSLVTMFGGATVFGYIIGNMANLLATRNAGTKKFHSNMDQLEEFMQAYLVPDRLVHRIRRHFATMYAHEKIFDEVSILSSLPGSLGVDLSLHMRAELVSSVELFRSAHPAFVAQVIREGKTMVEGPGEWAQLAGEVGREVMFLEKGHCEIVVGNHTLNGDDSALTVVAEIHPGSVFGEPAAIFNRKHPWSVRTKTACKFLAVPNDSFLAALDDHDELFKVVRKSCLDKVNQFLPQSNLRKIFDEIDDDGGGSLDEEELKACFLKCDLALSQTDFDYVWHSMSHLNEGDDDSEISFEAFRDWMASGSDVAKLLRRKIGETMFLKETAVRCSCLCVCPGGSCRRLPLFPS